jgi:hypothetical protein
VSQCPARAAAVSTADPAEWVPAPDYATFYPHLSEPFNIADCKWANNGHRPKAFLAGDTLDLVPVHKRHKDSQVIKDKDVALHNATVTDVIVTADENVVHINCVAHAHMHVEKCAPGNLEHPDALVCCLSWLKKIDEGNKVTCDDALGHADAAVVVCFEATTILCASVSPLFFALVVYDPLTILFVFCGPPDDNTTLFCLMRPKR